MDRMPFGKFRGQLIADLPDWYLRWLAGRNLHDPLLSAIKAEVETRSRRAEPDYSSHYPDPKLAEQVIASGFRMLSKKLHPDVGGSHEEMIALNDCVEWLRQQVRRVAC